MTISLELGNKLTAAFPELGKEIFAFLQKGDKPNVLLQTALLKTAPAAETWQELLRSMHEELNSDELAENEKPSYYLWFFAIMSLRQDLDEVIREYWRSELAKSVSLPILLDDALISDILDNLQEKQIFPTS